MPPGEGTVLPVSHKMQAYSYLNIKGQCGPRKQKKWELFGSYYEFIKMYSKKENNTVLELFKVDDIKYKIFSIYVFIYAILFSLLMFPMDTQNVLLQIKTDFKTI